MDYWRECIAEAFEDAKIAATDEQIDCVTSWVEGAHENHGLATGRDCIPNPLEQENEKLKRELKIERDKVPCPECCGNGYITSIWPGTSRSSTSDCWKCRGEGKISY